MTAPSRTRPLVLCILDGFGERAERDAESAIRLARTPSLDALGRLPRTRSLGTGGPDVGLPPERMGNSEVGHLNFGAGRIAMMGHLAHRRRRRRRQPAIEPGQRGDLPRRPASSPLPRPPPPPRPPLRRGRALVAAAPLRAHRGRALGGRAGRRPRLPRRTRHAAAERGRLPPAARAGARPRQGRHRHDHGPLLGDGSRQAVGPRAPGLPGDRARRGGARADGLRRARGELRARRRRRVRRARLHRRVRRASQGQLRLRLRLEDSGQGGGCPRAPAVGVEGARGGLRVQLPARPHAGALRPAHADEPPAGGARAGERIAASPSSRSRSTTTPR